MAAATVVVARRRGLDPAPFLAALPAGARPAVPVDGADAADLAPVPVERWGPWLPGLVREEATTSGRRRGEGIHHTPPEVAVRVLELVERHTDVLARATPVIGDPAVGGGAFLLAALAAVVGRGADTARRRHRLAETVVGADTDPLAVATTRLALGLWAGRPVRAPGLVVGDFTETGFVRRPDLIVGNPPFRTPQRRATGRSAERRARLVARWPELDALSDDAVVFWRACLDAVAEGGTLALVQPTSVMGAAGAEAVRRLTHRRARLVAAWIPGCRLFAAAVDVWVPIAVQHPGGPAAVGETTVARHLGWPPDEPVAVRLADPGTWAGLDPVADAAPRPDPAEGPTLGDVARVVAGHRDQFYGLRAAVRDDPGAGPRLVTSGLIDPWVCRWGRRRARYDRRVWATPTVDLAAVPAAIDPWVRARLVPKVVVASQTRVVEAAVDADGCWVPSTPVVSIEPHPGGPDPWMVAAAVASPASAARVVRAAAGTGLSPGSIRVNRGAVAALPAPLDSPRW
ncbi:MAG: hypothetical protein D6683_04555, partial [Actinomyces sp.]